MNTMIRTLVLAAGLALLTTGCYTKLYRPLASERAGTVGPYDQLYNRYDSTAIDTTLTPPPETYPNEDYGWYSWGRPRTRWGFDFYNFSPDYYWSYYGYYDYYSVPWWGRYNDPWYYWGWSPPSTPAEPPAQRDYGRRGRPEGGGGGSYVAPPSGSGSVARPQQNPPEQPQTPPPNQNQGDTNKRSGRRGR